MAAGVLRPQGPGPVSPVREHGLMLDGFPLIDVHLHAARKPTLKLPWDTWVQGFADRDVMDRLYDAAGAVIPAAFDALLAAEGVDIGLLMCEYSPKVTGLQAIEDMLPIAAVQPRPGQGHRERQPAPALPGRRGGPPPARARRGRAQGPPGARRRRGQRPDALPRLRGLPGGRRPRWSCTAAPPPSPASSNAFGDPVVLDDVLRDFRSLTLVLAHGGRGWWYDAAAFLALSHERVWIELSGLPPSRLRDYYARQNWNRLTRRMIFGTDWPGIPGIAANARAVAQLMPDEDTAAAVLAGNAVRVYNLKAAYACGRTPDSATVAALASLTA